MTNTETNHNPAKNLLEVDLGFYGKVNAPGGVSAATFFRSLEARQKNKDLVAIIREKYNDVLENEIYPKIEKKIKEYLEKIADTRSSGDLKKLMNRIADEGLIVTEKGQCARNVYFRKHPQIERTRNIIIAYTKKKTELAQKYDEIMSKPNGIRIDGRKPADKGDRRTGSYSLVLTLEFGENKNHQETVIISDCLPVHGPAPDLKSRSYVVGYSVPGWLKYKIDEVKQKIKESEEKLKTQSAEAETKNTAVVINIETAIPQETKNKDEKEADLIQAAA